MRVEEYQIVRVTKLREVFFEIFRIVHDADADDGQVRLSVELHKQWMLLATRCAPAGEDIDQKRATPKPFGNCRKAPSSNLMN